MLPVAQRLRRSGDFAATIRGGRRAGRGGLVVHLLPTELPMPETASSSAERQPVRGDMRAGFVVPKAVGGAVVRNRVKRRLRELVRERHETLAYTDLVVRALPGSAARSYQQLGVDLDMALAAARARRGNHR
jgi:ribonuclease P protein component